MTLSPLVEWLIFGCFAAIAIAGALGMATTMSMFRSGVFLMASFIGVAGLFILLSADLLSLLQIMMYIGGMLVMILFMVVFSHDPGGAMMAGMMELPPIERFFSLGLKGSKHQGADDMGHESKKGHEDEQHQGDNGENQGEHQESDIDMSEMSMTTPLKRYAALLATVVGILLVVLLLLRPAWPVLNELPNPNSAWQVGSLLMGKYMIAFEGAGLLILLGIFGAVFISRPGQFPDSGDRGLRVSVDAPPAPIDGAQLEPLAASGEIGDLDNVDVSSAHRDTPERG
ncbi:MAG TPA: NADH-quinone oxidoreductase subunit J, partial [Candidatus Binatia bacterium]|nr:NADH-quinone oxidoreductase subunit J [Candidatus Binatia bacterium]